MKIDRVLSEDIIDLEMDAGSKLAALNHLIDLLVTKGRVDSKDDFLNQVQEREKIESTDFGIGVAIPHGRTTAVLQPSIAIGKLNEPFYWNSSDDETGKPVFSIFLMATSPDDQEISHLQIIARVASLLIEEDFIHFLSENHDPQALLKEIKTYLGENDL